MSDMGYTAPNWANGKPPAINATRLNDLCSTVQTLDRTMPTKQDKLTFDSTPTQGSTNPVTSGGVYGHRVVAGQKSGTTLGQYATAEGDDTTASGVYSHAEGDGTTASGWGCHAEGQKTIANASNQMDLSNPTNPYGSSHAEGFKTTASGEASHAEGSNTKATGMTSHAEGIDTIASGVASHAEGMRTIASGNGGSHAEGVETTASGVASHAEGEGTIAHSFQHVFGKYNVAITDLEGEIAEIVGWGTSDTKRKSIRIMDIYGNMTIAGTLTQSSDAELKTVEGEIPDVSEVHAVRFRWNDVNGQHDDLDHVGYIAQDVEKVAPFMVKKDSNGYKALDYIAFLCAKMELLERRVKELEEKKE